MNAAKVADDIFHEVEMCACLAVCPTTREWAKIMHVGDECCTHPITKAAYPLLMAAGWQEVPHVLELVHKPLGEASGLYRSIAHAVESKLWPEWHKGEGNGILYRFQVGARETFPLWSRPVLRWAAERMNAGEWNKAMRYIAPIVSFGASPRAAAGKLWLYGGWRFEDINTLAQEHEDVPRVLREPLPKAADMVTPEEWAAWNADARYVYEERMGVADELGMDADEAHRQAASMARIEQAKPSPIVRQLIDTASTLFNADVVAIKPRTMTKDKDGLVHPVEITKEVCDG